MVEEWKYKMPVALNRILQNRSVVHKDLTQTGSVASGNNETVDVTAPDGRIWFLRTLKIFVPPDADATSGSHRVEVTVRPNFVQVLLGKSSYDNSINYSRAYWRSADLNSEPAGDVAPQQVVSDILIDDANGIQFLYHNGTDVAQENDREYYIDCLELIVS